MLTCTHMVTGTERNQIFLYILCFKRCILHSKDTKMHSETTERPFCVQGLVLLRNWIPFTCRPLLLSLCMDTQSKLDQKNFGKRFFHYAVLTIKIAQRKSKMNEANDSVFICMLSHFKHTFSFIWKAGPQEPAKDHESVLMTLLLDNTNDIWFINAQCLHQQ